MFPNANWQQQQQPYGQPPRQPYGQPPQQPYGQPPPQNYGMPPPNQNMAIRAGQINQMMQYHPGSSLLNRSNDKEEFKVPLILSVSPDPLYIKVIVPFDFPVGKPIFQVLARVNHPDIDSQLKIYTGASIRQWSPVSSLLVVLRAMHGDFQKNPPIPEHLSQGQNPQAQQPSHPPQQQQQQQPDPRQQVPQQPQASSSQGRSDQQRQEAAQQRMDREFGAINNLHTSYMNSMTANKSLHELKKMKEDPEFRNDAILSDKEYLAFLKKKDQLEDDTLKEAQINLELANRIEADNAKHQKDHAEFKELEAEAGRLLAQLDAQQQKNSREQCAKVLQTASNAAYDVSYQAQKQFKKGQLQINDYIKKFLESRREYYLLEEQKKVILGAPE